MLFEKVISKKYKILEQAEPETQGTQQGNSAQGESSKDSGVENASENAYQNRAKDASEEDSKKEMFELYKSNLKNTLIKFLNVLDDAGIDPKFEQTFDELSSALTNSDIDKAFDSFKRIIDGANSRVQSKYIENPIKSLEKFQQ